MTDKSNFDDVEIRLVHSLVNAVTVHTIFVDGDGSRLPLLLGGNFLGVPDFRKPNLKFSY